MIKMTPEEFEAHINDTITKIGIEKATGKLTERQFAAAIMDLAKWAADRSKYLPQSAQVAMLKKRLGEALDK